jgi:hypothetical protein
MEVAWLVNYEISPFPGNEFISNGIPPQNGNIGEFRIFTFKREGNVYTMN